MPKRPPRIEDPALAEVLHEALQKGALGLADACRFMRAMKGLTQAEFATHIGVALKVVKDLESEKGNPTLESLNQVASAAGLQVGFIRPSATVSLGDVRRQVERQARERRAELHAVKQGKSTLRKRHASNALCGTDFTIELPKLV